MLHNSPYTQPTSSGLFFSLFYLTNVMYIRYPTLVDGIQFRFQCSCSS